MIEYIVFFVDEDGNPEEWAASSTSFNEAMYYLNAYSQDGPVGLFTQPEPKPVMAHGERLVIK